MNGDETQHLPPMPSPRPQRREPEGVADSRDDLEAQRQDQIPTTEIPLRGLPSPFGPNTPTAPIPHDLVKRVVRRQAPEGPASPLPPGTGRQLTHNTPPTPFPGPRHNTTEPFGAVLAVPGQNTTQAVPVQGGGPRQKTTAGFRGVLPLPAGPGPAPPSVLQPGATVGAFTLQACVEDGPTFTVYRAQHAQHGQVRLEIVTEAAAQHTQAFLLEARLRTTLSDPRLVKVYGLGASPRPWLALEPVTADTLAEALAAGYLEPTRLARIVVDVAGALEHAHAHRVVHGDLRPKHVLLVGHDTARLTGFGQLTAISSGGTLCAFPGGPPIGPATYATPERFRGEPRRKEDDIYALGVLLYHGALGRPPFHGTPAEVRRGVLDHHASLPPTQEGSQLEELLRVAMRCLAKRPADRYPSARAVGAALQQILRPPAPLARGNGGAIVAGLLVLAFLAVAAIVAALALS